MPFSLLAAFLGGLISLLSPCSAMILPGFFATSFHQKKRLVLATAIFSLGILTAIIPLGLGFIAIFTYLNSYRQIITTIIGAILITEGVLQLTGKSLFLPKIKSVSVKSPKLSSSFSLGLISGIGASSCVGPVLGAIITLAANSSSLTNAFFMIIAYSLGLIVPLFLLALLWQSRQDKATSILKGKVINIGAHKIHSVNLIAGILFIVLGYIFVVHQGSFGTMRIFTHTGILNFTFDLQDKLFKL